MQHQLSETGYRNLYNFDHLDEPDVRGNYSGRSMYGKSCIGVVGGQSSMLHMVTTIAVDYLTDGSCELDEIDLAGFIEIQSELVGSVRSDSMGRGTIWYLPNVEAPENWRELDEQAKEELY